MKYLLLCGVHGDEQNAVLSTIKAYNVIQQEKHASIQMDNWIVNVPALRACEREFPGNDKSTNDMNRMYGNDSDFNPEEAIEQIKQKIMEVDVVIDIHNSPACANSILISNSDYAEDYVKFASEMGICYIVSESATNTAKKFAIASGKIGFTVELGGMGFCPEFKTVIDKNVQFIHRLVMSIESYVQRGGRFEKKFPMVQNCIVRQIYAHNEGIVDYTKALGESFRAGEVIGGIYAPNGKLVEKIVAPFDGWFADSLPKIWVEAGDVICELQPASR
jgi:predicted deacylase